MKPSKTVGWPALTLAAAGALFVVLVVTETFGRGSIFCGDWRCAVEGVLWSLPAYATMLAIVVASTVVTAALVRARVGPSSVRTVALSTAIAGVVAYLVVSSVSLDVAWAGAFSGRLTPPAPTPLLPTVLATITAPLWTASLMLTGVSIALTSLLLLPLRAPLLLVALGWIAGVALVALVPSGQIYAVDVYRVPVAFLAVTAWALWLALLLLRPAFQPRRVR